MSVSPGLQSFMGNRQMSQWAVERTLPFVACMAWPLWHLPWNTIWGEGGQGGGGGYRGAREDDVADAVAPALEYNLQGGRCRSGGGERRLR